MTPDTKAAHYRIAEHVGRKVRLLRIELTPWSQQQLADRVGCTRPGISMLESGKQCPPIGKLYVIAHLLGVHPSELLPEPGAVNRDWKRPAAAE